MNKQIKSNVYWVGKSDWELRQFHGYEYSTYRGTSYNSYLVREEKNVLIDTVFKPFSGEFIANLEEEINLDQIDFIVANHAEIDHSGALPDLMKRIPCSMFCYLTGDHILFSNDAFGQHFCSEPIFNDLVDQYELYYEAIKY